MGLFGRKSSSEKYEEQKQQEFLATQREEQDRKQYVDQKVLPWIDALAANRNGDAQLSDELLEKVGELSFPPRSEDAGWFSGEAQSLIRRKAGRANIDASFAEREPDHDAGKTHLMRVEQEFWMSVLKHVSTQGIIAGR